jgi:hypothetical protein
MFNKLSYTVFHSPKLNYGLDRSVNVEKIKKTFFKNIDYIDSEVFVIKSIEDYKKILKENKELRKINISGRFRLGAVGLVFTTYVFYKKILSLDYNYFLILEDDAQISDDCLEKIFLYLKEVPKDFDILSLYENFYFHKKYNEKKHNIGLKNVCLSYNNMSTLAYIISKKGIEKYLEYMENVIDLPIDLYLFDNKKNTKKYAIKPNDKQIFYSDFFKKDNGEPLDNFSNINNTKEIVFNVGISKI